MSEDKLKPTQMFCRKTNTANTFPRFDPYCFRSARNICLARFVSTRKFLHYLSLNSDVDLHKKDVVKKTLKSSQPSKIMFTGKLAVLISVMEAAAALGVQLIYVKWDKRKTVYDTKDTEGAELNNGEYSALAAGTSMEVGLCQCNEKKNYSIQTLRIFFPPLSHCNSSLC